MTEKPILFSGPMVRAILEGRKTQTRRVVKPQPDGRLEWIETKEGFAAWEDPGMNREEHSEDGGPCQRVCPFGQPGDRLWVKETWRERFDLSGERCFQYRANTNMPELSKWKSSLFCSRLISRLTLEIVYVRVERLHEIGLGDIIKEGIDDEHRIGIKASVEQMRSRFRILWNSINEKRGFGWDANPWVWVIEFKKVLEGGK